MFLLISILPFIKSYCENKNLLFCDICADGNTCTHCVIGYSPDLNESSNTYGTCLPCKVPNCLSCSADWNVCNLCKDGTYLVKDKNSPNYGKCLACQPGCKICDGPDNCVRCIHGYGLNENQKCVKCLENCYKCGSDYHWCEECTSFSGLSALNGVCQKCQVEHCLSCNANNALVCNKCEDKYFIRAGLCATCEDPNCEQCDTKGICTKCESKYYLKNGKCHKCIDHCLQCEEHECNGDENCVQFECTKCENGYYFSERDGWKCVYTGIMNCRDYEYPKEDGVYRCFDCEDGYGLTEDGTSCFKCDDPNCNMCDQGPEFCEFCSNFTQWNKGKCVSGCLDPYCEECNPYDYEDCIYCKYGYGLVQVKEEYEFDGQTYIKTMHYCSPCKIENCRDCDIGHDFCLVCNSGYRIKNNVTCEKCTDPNCDECLQSADFCEYCKSGFHLTQTGVCIQCNPQNCYDCSDSPSVCFQCNEGFTFDLREGSSTFGQCLRCSITNCQTCDFTLEFCTECSKGYTLIGGHCYDEFGNEESGSKNKDINKKGKSKTGLIVGVVIAVIAVIAIVVVVVVLLRRKYKRDDSSSFLFVK